MLKAFIIIAIIAIIITLGSALIGMLKGNSSGSDKMFKSLATRVGLSVFLFLLLMFAAYMGWIEPNTIIFNTNK